MVSFSHAILLLLASNVFVELEATLFSALNLTVLERLPGVPQGWRRGAAVPGSKRLDFRIAIKQEGAFAFEQQVVAISTPDHPLYGQHMGREEVRRMLRPSSKASAAIFRWLDVEGVPVTDVEDNSDWINFFLSASKAERILDTKFHYYTNSANEIESIRTLRYSVPESLHRYIQLIQPTTRFPQIRTQFSAISDHFAIVSVKTPDNQSIGLDVTFCNITITPQCLKDLYHIGDYQGKDVEANKIGIGGFLDEYAKFDDYTEFAQKFAPDAANENFTFVLTSSGISIEDAQEDTVNDSVEGNLDSQYAFTLGFPAKGIYYSTPGSGPLIPDLDQPSAASNQNEPFLDFLHYMIALSDQDLPTVLSISYGEDEQSIPASYANATCSLFAQLGARGVSVVVSSGDTGVGSACQTNDGTNTTRFNPIFPASCPFVTAVGGTQHVQPEKAAGFSAGGFSDLYCRPTYQDNAVNEYIDKLGDRWQGLYNPEGRGFPDVAAQAYNFTVLDHGKYIRVSGTSNAAPTFAAIISLLNGDRMSTGSPPLGFLNPFIYQIGYQGLTDIVDGGSSGCTGVDLFTRLKTPFVPFASWNATEGWDPVTGFGTPDFRKLLKLIRQSHRRRPFTPTGGQRNRTKEAIECGYTGGKLKKPFLSVTRG